MSMNKNENSASSLQMRRSGDNAPSGEGTEATVFVSTTAPNNIQIDLENVSAPSINIDILDVSLAVLYSTSVTIPLGNPLIVNINALSLSVNNVIIRITNFDPNPLNIARFYINNVIVSSTQTYSNVVCDDKGGYRYGYQRNEKDDEIAGSGNHLSFNDF